MKIKIGHGIDIHQLVEGRKLILAGVVIPYEKGLLGHSDADVVYHALTDAMLGALGRGDIGKHFSNTDPKWKNKDSSFFVETVMQDMEKSGFKISNIDINITAEAPRLAGYTEEMKINISRLTKISPDCVNVKALTNEGLGALGRGEGICADCTLLIVG